MSLEYKRQMYERTSEHRIEMLRDVASIANAEGGVLIVGMAEQAAGVAAQLQAVPNAKAEATRLLDTCLAHISERIPGLRTAPVGLAGGGEVFLVWIPRSYRRPHMVTLDGSTEFWIRHDREKARMSIAEIRSAIAASEDLAVRAEVRAR